MLFLERVLRTKSLINEGKTAIKISEIVKEPYGFVFLTLDEGSDS